VAVYTGHVHVYTTVYIAVYTGRVYGRVRAVHTYTTVYRQAVRTAVYTQQCMYAAVYTACPCRVHGRLHDVYTGRVGAMYTYATVYMAVYTVVYGPCTGR